MAEKQNQINQAESNSIKFSSGNSKMCVFRFLGDMPGAVGGAVGTRRPRDHTVNKKCPRGLRLFQKCRKEAKIK